MRLIKLEASDERFKTVRFNRTGISFILAKQADPEVSDVSKTYNGVGKSLLLAIIHFCLGSSKKPSFEEKLPEWTFYLTVEIQGKEYIFARSTNEQNVVYVNEEKYGEKKFKNFLQEKCFRIPEDTPFLSFRSLIPFFIRPNRASYINCMNPGDARTDYQIQLYNAFLVGLSIDLARKKHDLKRELDNIKASKKNISNDPLLKTFLSDQKSTELTIIELDEKIEKLEHDIAHFEVAEDYDDVVKEGDAWKRALSENRNKLNLLDAQLKNIEESLKIDPDLNSREIIDLYNEAKTVLHDAVVRALHEVETFYSNLNEKRTKRLWSQKSALLQSQRELEKEQQRIQESLDRCLKFLGEHKAIDVYRAAVQQREDLIREKEKITQFERLLEEYNAKELTCKQDLLKTIEQVTQYLSNDKKSIETLRDYFRLLAKRFYPKSASGITVVNNTGENQICYDIDPKIDLDNSTGIGNVKTLCYDLTILFCGVNHFIRFLFHDSCILHGIDEVHIDEWFRVLNEKFPKSGEYQYIATINQNQVELLKQNLTEDEFAKTITDHVVLTLTDEGDDGKLLGLTADIRYE